MAPWRIWLSNHTLGLVHYHRPFCFSSNRESSRVQNTATFDPLNSAFCGIAQLVYFNWEILFRESVSFSLRFISQHMRGNSEQMGVFASLPVTLFNLGSIFGFIVMGWIVDRTHATTCILLSTVGSTLSVFLIWGFSLSLPPLYVFSITYGVFAGSYATTWPAVIGEIRKKKELADPGTIFAYLQAGRGIGSIISGPLSEALVRYNFGGSTGWAYGSSYGPIIIFTGITAFLGGLGVVA
ncbi:major facilitator superfamily domain-containing protein [Penicillium chrysogenum]|nr:major facilitator superfamily domain-containing protein [Penicillium chrysogenum]